MGRASKGTKGSKNSAGKTGGNCFLCLSEVPPQLITSVKVDADGEPDFFQFQPVSEFYPEYSLQYLFHYLRLGWGAAVPIGETSPSRQSVNVIGGKSGLKVVLCEGCGDLNSRFAELYQQLEKIQMELQHCLRSVQLKLTQAKTRKTVPSTLFMGRGEGDLLEVREEVMQKCVEKLERANPTVNFKKLDEETLQRLQPVVERKRRKGGRKMKMTAVPAADIEAGAENSGFSNMSENESSESRLEDFMMEEDEAPDNLSETETGTLPEKRRARKTYFNPKKGCFRRSPDTGKFKCPECDKEFLRYSSVQTHHRELHLKPENLLHCDLCEKRFSSETCLKTHHRSVHLQLKPFQCDECGLKFSRPFFLKEHQQEVHLKMKPHVCEECGKDFARKRNLIMHQRTVHLKIRSHQCDKCESKFSLAKDLRAHRDSVHFKLRSYICDLCGKAFSFPKDLKRHNQIVHLQLKPHQCSQCDKKFARADELKRHCDSVHLTSHECKQCGKHFNQYGDLKLHRMKDHRDHLCDLCGKGFHLVSSLKRHRKKVHSRFECETCQQHFPKQRDLNAHVASESCGGIQIQAAQIKNDLPNITSPSLK